MALVAEAREISIAVTSNAGARVELLDDAAQPSSRASVKLFLSIALACVSPVMFGFCLGFTSPTEGTMQGHYNDLGVFDSDEMSWYASLINIGAVVGAFLGLALCERVGRKKAIAFSAIPLFMGWVGTVFARRFSVLLSLRLLIGVGVGIGSTATPLYIAETATMELRGSLGACNQLSVTIGIFLVNLVGTYGFTDPVDGAVQWRQMAMMGAVLAAVLVLLLFVPESPAWLAKRGDKANAQIALMKLRRGDNTAELATFFAAAVGGADQSPADGNDDALGSPDSRQSQSSQRRKKGMLFYGKSCVIGFGLLAFQQLSGINAVIFYTASICEEAGVQNANLAAMVSMGYQVLLTFVSCLLMEAAGRRILLLFGTLSMAAAHCLLAYYFAAQAASWVALGALGLFLTGFSLAMGPIPWMIVGEIFPIEARASAAAVGTALNWSISFVVTKLFDTLQRDLGQAYCFLLFGGICWVLFFFVVAIVPETRGKTVEEVLAEMRGERPHCEVI